MCVCVSVCVCVCITLILIHYKCAYRDLCYQCYQNSISIRIGTVLPVHIRKSNSDYF